jgi:hypothetical protein
MGGVAHRGEQRLLEWRSEGPLVHAKSTVACTAVEHGAACAEQVASMINASPMQSNPIESALACE